MADKQLKANRKFMEEQAAEREQERDEFSKELDKLRVILKEKDKDKTSHENYEKEVNYYVKNKFYRRFLQCTNNFLITKNPFFFLSIIYARKICKIYTLLAIVSKNCMTHDLNRN